MQTIILFILVLVSFARVSELFPSLEPFQLGKVAFVLGFVFLFFLPKGHIKLFFSRIPFLKFIVLFYGICFLSIPFAIWKGGAFDVFLTFTRVILICFIVILFSSNFRLQQLRLALFFSISVLVVSMLQNTDSLRLSVSSTYDSNDIGVLLLTFFPLILAEAVSCQKLLRIGYAVLASGVLYCIVLTGSRGAIVALAMQAMYLVYASKRFKLLVICSVILASIFVASVADVSLWERFQSLAMEGDQADYNLTDSSGRLAIWKNGLEIFAHNPILGVGVGQFGTALFYLDGKIGLTAHNTYLQIAVELGFIGFMLFITLLWRVWALIQIYDGRGPNSLRWFAVKVGMIGHLVGIFFISAAYSPIVYYFFGLVAVMHYAENDKPSVSFNAIYLTRSLSKQALL